MLRQQIVGVAENRLQDSLTVRKGESGGLRCSTMSRRQKSKLQFCQSLSRYRKREASDCLDCCTRRQQTQQIVQRMGARQRGATKGFDDLMKDYARVASTDLDPKVG